jgi:hypothetical protein
MAQIWHQVVFSIYPDPIPAPGSFFYLPPAVCCICACCEFKKLERNGTASAFFHVDLPLVISRQFLTILFFPENSHFLLIYYY